MPEIIICPVCDREHEPHCRIKAHTQTPFDLTTAVRFFERVTSGINRSDLPRMPDGPYGYNKIRPGSYCVSSPIELVHDRIVKIYAPKVKIDIDNEELAISLCKLLNLCYPAPKSDNQSDSQNNAPILTSGVVETNAIEE